MASSPDDTYDFLTRAYKVVRVVALTIVSVTGVVVSIVAFQVNINHVWWDVRIPLYALTLAAVPLVVLYGLLVVGMGVFLRDELGTLSYYKNKSKSLEVSVKRLEDIAYNDPITGIPNSRALEREIDRGNHAPGVARCLILLDLKDFGQINKRYNHWKGDEYLRRFSDLVTASSRRNEFVFKRRPTPRPSTGEVAEEDDVKAFRRNSGGDEFFILLEGTVVDGLGYLNRLQKRAKEFEAMSTEVLGARHPFKFHAGLLAVARSEPFESVSRRVADCLRLAQDDGNPLRLYWSAKEVPPIVRGSIEDRVLGEVHAAFAKRVVDAAPDTAAS